MRKRSKYRPRQIIPDTMTWVRAKAAQPVSKQGVFMNYQGGVKYTGPAKPIRLWRRPLIDYFECVVFLSGIVVVGLDVYVWRANMPL